MAHVQGKVEPHAPQQGLRVCLWSGLWLHPYTRKGALIPTFLVYAIMEKFPKHPPLLDLLVFQGRLVTQHRERNIQEAREPYTSCGGEIGRFTCPEGLDVFGCVYEGKFLNASVRGTFNRGQAIGFSSRAHDDVPPMDINVGKDAVIGDE